MRQTTRQVTAKLLPIFRERGYDGASLEALAAAAGLTRGSLYHHFPEGKEQMAHAVLVRSGSFLSQYVLAPLHADNPPAVKLYQMLEGVLKYYEGDPPVCMMNSLTLGDGLALFGPRVRAAVTAWHKSLRDVFVEMGLTEKDANQKATKVLSTIQGSLILARAAASRKVFVHTIQHLQQDLKTT